MTMNGPLALDVCSFWNGTLTEQQLLTVQQQVEQHSWKAQKDAGASHCCRLTAQRSCLMTELVATVCVHDIEIMRHLESNL